MPCIVRAVKLFITIFPSCSCRHLILQKFCSVGAALSPGRRPPVPCLGGWTCPTLEQLLGVGASAELPACRFGGMDREVQ